MAQMELGERLRWLRKHIGAGMGYRRFSSLVEIPERSYFGYENNLHEPPCRAVAQIARRTGCNVVWLMFGEGEPFGGRGGIAESPTAYQVARTIPILTPGSSDRTVGEDVLPADLHEIRVTGTMLHPLVAEGQYVLCVKAPPGNGDLAVIELRNEVLFGRVFVEDKGAIQVVSLSSAKARIVKQSSIRRQRKIWGIRF